MKPSIGLTLFAGMFISGCTSVQLQKNTVQQSWTVGAIQQQQVLDNLALFVCDYNALPSFTFPNQGGSTVTDSGNAGLTSGWSRITQAGPQIGEFLLTALGLSFGATRTAQEAFTLTPINDPRKLELMRCAYQRAVANCGFGGAPETGSDPVAATFDTNGHPVPRESQKCPDCEAIFNKFYTGDPNGNIADHAHGIVTSECLKSPCWFHVGCGKCVPKHCACVGHCGDVYVWVLPEGRNDLTHLTLAILDYAMNSAPVGLSKQIVYYIDEYGVPTQQKLAVGQVTATVAIDEQNASLLNTTNAEEVRIEQIIKTRLKHVNDEFEKLAEKVRSASTNEGRPGGAAKNDPDFERYKQLLTEKETLESKLAYLREQLVTPGLKQRFYPVGPSPAPASPLLQFNLQQSTLTAPIFSQ
jgi:hypothetical protein